MDDQEPAVGAYAIDIAADLRDVFGADAFAQAAERRHEAAAVDDPKGTAFWEQVCAILVGHDRIARQHVGCRP